LAWRDSRWSAGGRLLAHASGEEVDLVIEAGGSLLPVEVKPPAGRAWPMHAPAVLSQGVRREGTRRLLLHGAARSSGWRRTFWRAPW